MARYDKLTSSQYAAIHMWIRRHHGTPQNCDNCKTTEVRMYHWANISGTYKRERADWLRLCVPCHKNNDIQALGGKIKAKAKKLQPTKLCTRCRKEFSKNPRLSRKQWEATLLCSKKCAAKHTAKLIKGTKQTAETKALKSRLLKERWATNEQWREHVTNRMIGNQFARKQS